MDQYCEIEIKQPDLIIPKKFLGIKYGEKRIPQPPKIHGLYFDIYAWYLLWKEYKWDFDALGKKTPEELSSGMLYTGALSWLKEQIKPDFTKADIINWADELPAKKIKEIGKVLMESMALIEEMKAAGSKQGEKKK